MLVNVLIVFFIVLIFYQIFLANMHCVEGLENSSQVTTDPLVLEKQNYDKIADLDKNLYNLSKQAENAYADINLNISNLNSKLVQLDKRVKDTETVLFLNTVRLDNAEAKTLSNT